VLGSLAIGVLLVTAQDAAGAPAPPEVPGLTTPASAPPDLGALAAAVRSVERRDVAWLVSVDPRFAALGPEERARLLDAVAISRGWRVGASAANVLPGFGIGSLLEGDRRGLLLTAADVLAVLLFAFAVEDYAETPSGESSGTFAVTAPLAGLIFAAGKIAGVILPWTWNGRTHAALRDALGQLPPPPRESALLVAPVVASPTGRAAPGATLVLRF
jgi:hypothetical protein